MSALAQSLQRCLEAFPRVTALLKRVALLPRCLLLKECRLRIESPNSNPLEGVYIGEGLSLDYFRKLYCSPLLPSRSIPVWELPRAVRRARRSCDAVLVELNDLLARFLPGGAYFSEAWVGQVTNLNGDRYLHRVRGIERGWGQKVRHQKYEYRISRSENDLQRFYADIYIPYAHARFGADASIRPLHELRAALRRGFLLQVWMGDRWVSGLVVARLRDSVRLLAAGTVSLDALRQGALSALYFFLFRWAREAGIPTVDFCGSRPHLLDGVFRHKSLWGAEPVLDPLHHTKIAFYVNSEVSLPESVAGQLVNAGARFVPLGEVLSAGAAGLAPQSQPATTPRYSASLDAQHSR